MIASEKPVFPPGTRFIYSDINFEILGELVRRVSGQPLDVCTAPSIYSSHWGWRTRALSLAISDSTHRAHPVYTWKDAQRGSPRPYGLQYGWCSRSCRTLFHCL